MVMDKNFFNTPLARYRSNNLLGRFLFYEVPMTGILASVSFAAFDEPSLTYLKPMFDKLKILRILYLVSRQDNNFNED